MQFQEHPGSESSVEHLSAPHIYKGERPGDPAAAGRSNPEASWGKWESCSLSIVHNQFGSCQSNPTGTSSPRSEEHTSELQSLTNLVCRLLLEKKKLSTSCAPGQK